MPHETGVVKFTSRSIGRSGRGGSFVFDIVATQKWRGTKYPRDFPKDSVAYDTIKIDSILHARLLDFPKVNPAIKRGIPVKTQFVLPVIIKQE